MTQARSAIRNGRIVRLKVCNDCGVEKVQADEPFTDFYINRRTPDGRPLWWAARCKNCHRARESARRRERFATDPAYRERMRRNWKAYKDRKTALDPTYFADIRRMNRRLKAEQDGEVIQLPPKRGYGGRAPSGPFVAWLRAYQAVTGLANPEQLAADLGVWARNLTRLLNDGQTWVALDFVDTCLIAARGEANIDGRTIYTLDDLYPNRRVA